jgi:CheY-like chemotaxis protein
MATVLVVDDEPILRTVVAETLRDEGYAVSEAHDGEAALGLVAASPPDLVLMDVMMPGMDGREAYLAMRSRGDLPPVPVVLMSAGVGPESIDPSVEGYLPKPFDLDALVALVASLVGRAR